MKALITFLLAIISFGAQCQIGNNSGATRDDHTTGVEKIDVIGNVTVLVLDNELTVNSNDNNIKIEKVSLYDINGSLLSIEETERSSRISLNVSSFASGIYFVAIETNIEVITKKVFISSK